MRPADLRPGTRVVWNGYSATVTRTVGTPGQQHRWLIGLTFDDPTAAPIDVYANADQELET